jgi:nucleoside-diphosphate-sugar epimerase
VRILLIGGTGNMSVRIAEQAVAAGHDVMVVTRGKRPLPAGLAVKSLRAEREDLRFHADDFERFAPEAVVDSICFDTERAEDLVALFPKARRVVLVSSVDVYGEDVGAMQVTEKREVAPVTAYAKGKAAAEKVVLEGLGRRATVVRPSHILGRGFLTTSLWSRSPYLVDRILKGKAIPAIDGGRNLMTPVYAADIATWVMRIFESPVAGGEIFNAVGSETVTQLDYYRTIASILQRELEVVAIPSLVFKRRIAEPSQFNFHRPYSNAKAVARLDHRPVGTLRSMLEETVQHMLANAMVKDCAEHPIDDELVALAKRHEAELAAALEKR